ncbi:uncharacterized protein LOC112680767 isoform X2 [Sipha flava]|uniref:Uncharacterized protein LOC112680767 isoform X2 n=1 Tax=Sipha flava TaxID=143950 RepID=A0A8B8F7E5_9HEMI|nr:uncharacterized protein LOC112680767 isoform X2 [Sipha flava]
MNVTKYSVVHFYDDNTVEAVPKFWFRKNNGTCAWPKNTKNFHKLVEKHCIPNEMEYNFLEAREMCSGIESLIKAREKAKKAMFVSDFSDDDDKANRKFMSNLFRF